MLVLMKTIEGEEKQQHVSAFTSVANLYANPKDPVQVNINITAINWHGKTLRERVSPQVPRETDTFFR